MTRTILRGAALACLLAVGLTAPSAAQTFDIRLAGTSINDPNNAYLTEFKKRIEDKSGGRVKAGVFPAGQLGGGQRLIEGLQLGTIEMVVLPPSFFKGVNQVFQVLDAPGIFDDLAHAQRALTDAGFRDPFLKAAENSGIVGISLYVYDGVAYASVQPIRGIGDFKGKKIRVLASRVETEIMQRLGATGVPIDFTEIVPALQQRTIDTVRSSQVVMTGPKVFTAAKFLTITDDTLIPTASFVSKSFLDKLPSDLRATVIDIGLDMDDWTYKLAMQFRENVDKTWRENGAEIIRLPAQDQAELIQRVKPVGEDVLGKNPDAATREHYARLMQSVERTRKK
jgi:C4-dicarboxylate-binding protein DctP